MTAELQRIDDAITSMEHRQFMRQIESTKLFSRGEVFYFGKWVAWKRAAFTPEADRLLAEFRAQFPEPSPEG